MNTASTHPLVGRPQSPEHIRKRVESVARAKAAWTQERLEQIRQIASASNKAGTAESRRKNAEAHLGLVPWNKGNNWRLAVGDESARAIVAARAKSRRAKSPKHRINDRMSQRVRHSLKGRKGGRSWELLVGYTRDELEQHLLSSMPDGYGWDDFMSARLEIDHIRPIASFSFVDASDTGFRECWAMSNLRLLPAEENHRKRDKWRDEAPGDK